MGVVYLRDQRSICTFDDFWLDEIRDKQKPIFAIVMQLMSRERRIQYPRVGQNSFGKK
jgi:hypothetical protein